MQAIFRLYEELGCLNAVMLKASRMGLRSKQHRFQSGRSQGGNALSRGQIYALLRNPIYIGKIRHKTRVWDGQHEAIIDIELWDRVQTRLQSASARPRTRKNSSGPQNQTAMAPLTGKFWDETGERLTPTHTQRHGRRLRYYVTNRLISGGTDPQGWRLPAAKLEEAVATVIAQHIDSFVRGHRMHVAAYLQLGDAIATRALDLKRRLIDRTPDLLGLLIAEGRIQKGGITLVLNGATVSAALGLKSEEINPSALEITAPFTLRRRGVEGKIVVGNPEPEPDRTLLRALVLAHTWAADLRKGKTLGKIAVAANFSEAYIRTRVQLAFLSPVIQSAILDGRQPPELTLERLIRKPVPLDWEIQARLYGFGPDPRWS